MAGCPLIDESIGRQRLFISDKAAAAALLGVHVAVTLHGGPGAVGPLLVAVLAQKLLILLPKQDKIRKGIKVCKI